MKNWALEVLIVLSHSKRAQAAIFLGVMSFIVLHALAYLQLSDFQIQGPMAPLTEVFKENLYGRYDDAALGCLISFWGLAVKFYRKDKKRLFHF